MSIQIKNVSHIYGKGTPYETMALNNINLEINDGELVGLIGHTGSGKSTLIQHINGILKPDKGCILIDNVDITDKKINLRDIRRRIGLVFQYPEYQLFEETVFKDIAYGPKNLELSESEIEKRVRESINLVGLDFDEISERSPFELSGGQKRRVAIAGVLAMKPDVLILDEPTAGLDPQSKKELLKVIDSIHKREKNIMIFVSHNMTDVSNMCDKVLVMESGDLILSGTPSEVFSHREKLLSVGLNVPDITEMMYKLKEKGIKIDPLTFSVEEASDRIINALKKECLDD